MTGCEIKELAVAEGFHQAEIIDADKIVFDAAFRPYCEENLCGQYGANYSCPPDCGTPDQMKQKVLAHKKGLGCQHRVGNRGFLTNRQAEGGESVT